MTQLRDMPGLDLALLADAFRRRLGTGVLAALACLLAATTTLAMLPYSYTASALVLVKVARNLASTPLVGGQGSDQIVLTGVRPEDVASEIELLLSTVVSEAAIERLGGALPAGPPPAQEGFRAWLRRTVTAARDAAENLLVNLNLRRRPSEEERMISQIERGLRAERIARSDMIGVTLRWSSPQDAALVLNAVLDAYGGIRSDARRVFRGGGMFQDLVQQSETRLAELAAAIEEARRQAGVADAEQQIRSASLRIGTIDIEVQAADLALVESTREVELLRTRRDVLIAAPPEREPQGADELTLGLRRRLADLRLDQLRDQQRLGERSEQARGAAEAVIALQTELRRADLARIDREVDAHLLRLELMRSRRGALLNERAGALEAAQRLQAAQALISALERRQATEDAGFRRLRGQEEEATTLARLDAEGVSNIRVLGGARALSAPTGPRKVLLLGVSILISLFVGLGTMIGLEWFGRFSARARPLAGALSLERTS